MIEKPKRSKQLTNQERKIPADIQELITRYDLDNNDIYKYLEYLVDTINTFLPIPEVIDSLTSSSSTDSLSAKQGKVLNEKIETLTTYSLEERVVGTWIDRKDDL